MVKITEPMQGLLSNSEVLQVLHDRGAEGKSLSARALPSEKLVYSYLANHSPGLRQPAALKQFIDLLQPFKLSRAEVLNILNICPVNPVDVYLLVDRCDERLTEQQVDQLLDLVAMHLKH